MIAKSSQPLLLLDNVGYHIDGKSLVEQISFAIYPQDIVSIIGPNGAGKSTLVRLILGLLTPTTGKITKGQYKAAYVPQKFTLPAILPLQVKDLLAQADSSALTNKEQHIIYELLSITTLINRQVAVLSGGELQRTLLARALLTKPTLLVLDEPMQGLDPEAQTQLYQLIDSLPDFLRCAMLVVSHDLHWVMQGTKRVVCLNKHIRCQGLPTDIVSLPEFIALFADKPAYSTPYFHTHPLTVVNQ